MSDEEWPGGSGCDEDAWRHAVHPADELTGDIRAAEEAVEDLYAALDGHPRRVRRLRCYAELRAVAERRIESVWVVANHELADSEVDPDAVPAAEGAVRNLNGVLTFLLAHIERTRALLAVLVAVVTDELASATVQGPGVEVAESRPPPGRRVAASPCRSTAPPCRSDAPLSVDGRAAAA